MDHGIWFGIKMEQEILTKAFNLNILSAHFYLLGEKSSRVVRGHDAH